jgi:hypothetical protein
MSFIVWSQMAHCIMSLHRLTTLTEPGWDGSMIRQRLDIIDICDQILAEMTIVSTKRRQARNAQTRTDEGLEDVDTYNRGMFDRCVRLFRSMREGWAAELTKIRRTTTTTTPGLTTATAISGDSENVFVDGITAGPLAVPAELSEDVNDRWLVDIFNWS